MEYLIIVPVFAAGLIYLLFSIRKYKILYKNTIKQSFSMTVAMGEYHMWIEDHLENYLMQQVLNNETFLEFAKKSGLPIISFETILKDRMKESANYIKLQSNICLRRVSEPLSEDINALLEKQ